MTYGREGWRGGTRRNVTNNKNITVKNKRKIQQIKKEENIEKNMHDTLNY